MLYKSLVRSRFDYKPQVYGAAVETQLKKLNVLQNTCLRTCLGALKCTRIDRLETEASVLTLKHRRNHMSLNYAYKVARQHNSQHPTWTSIQQHYAINKKRPTTFCQRIVTLYKETGVPLSEVDK